MPSSLSTVIEWIADIPNKENQESVQRFVAFMKDTDTSEKYQRVNLIVVILFAKFLGPHNLLNNIKTQQGIIRFLDSNKKNEILDPDKRWIRTWNDYLQRIKYFMRWLHNDPSAISFSEWQTPQFARIKRKRTIG